MKSATFPSLRVDPKLRDAAEDVLAEGETLSGFIEDSIRSNIDRRVAQREFIARALEGREDARRTGRYWSAAEVMDELTQRLERAKAKASSKK